MRYVSVYPGVECMCADLANHRVVLPYMTLYILLVITTRYTGYGCVYGETHMHTHNALSNTCMLTYTHTHTLTRTRTHTHTVLQTQPMFSPML